MIRSIINPKNLIARQFAFVRCFATNPEVEVKPIGEKKTKRRYNNSFIPTNFRFQYQEFLPDPRPRFRNEVKERLERKAMLDRRANIYIPEFYVGSVIAVTSSDPHSQGKTNRFVGICIDRECSGLNANFILRNVIDNQGLEIKYDLYDPTLQKLEVLRLEKRLDSKLYYLRDSLPEYSTFDLNMEPEVFIEGNPVPVNDLKVKLKPRPWLERWERQDLKGVENVDELLYDKHRRLAKVQEKPWEKYDLMKEYRRTLPEEEQVDIFSEIYTRVRNINDDHKKKLKARRSISKTSKLA